MYMDKHITMKPTSLLTFFFLMIFLKQGFSAYSRLTLNLKSSHSHLLSVLDYRHSPHASSLMGVYCTTPFPNTECQCPLHWSQLTRDKGRVQQGSVDALGFSPKTRSHAQGSLVAQPMGPWGSDSSFFFLSLQDFPALVSWGLCVCSLGV